VEYQSCSIYALTCSVLVLVSVPYNGSYGLVICCLWAGDPSSELHGDKEANEAKKLDGVHALPASSVKDEKVTSANKYGNLKVSCFYYAARLNEELKHKMPRQLYLMWVYFSSLHSLL